MQLIRKKRGPSCITNECMNEHKTHPEKWKIIGLVALNISAFILANVSAYFILYNRTCPIPNFSEMRLSAFLHRGQKNAFNESELEVTRKRRNVEGNGNF